MNMDNSRLANSLIADRMRDADHRRLVAIAKSSPSADRPQGRIFFAKESAVLRVVKAHIF